MKKLRILRLTNTCNACPAQWEGWLNDGRAIYIRYRWGYLSVRVSEEATKDIADAVSGNEIYGRRIGHGLDGFMDYDILKEKTGDVLIFPDIRSDG